MNETERLIKHRITESGAIGVDEFMSIVIAHYYKRQNPFGAKGDFITAPEISQMFGEIIGLWCANFWLEHDKPPFNLIEIGPGKGTLMSDVLRVAGNIDGFFGAMKHAYMVETSSRLRELQQEMLKGYTKCVWIEHIDKVEKGFSIIICNEFFDALPIKQFIRRGNRFHEIKVGTINENLAFIESNETYDFGVDCSEGSVLEVSPVAQQYACGIADKLKAEGGAALIIDYGYVVPTFQSTLQAVKQHKYHNPFKDIGEADITAHVDFDALNNIFQKKDLEILVYLQKDFLVENGIKLRAGQLIKAGADPKLISIDLDRLISPRQMGELFKILCVKI